VGLIELNPDYASGLQKVRNLYPYFYEVPELGFWGLGLYSKYPLRSSNLVSFGEHLPATIIAEIDFPQARFDVILVHPFPPMNAGLAADRNHHLDKIASYIAASGRSTIVLTDMNTAMWSHYHEKFVAHSGLRNARQGFGVASTWPPNKYLGVPIDHVFHSADTVVRNFRVLRSIGSDHLPIIAKIIIKHADSHNRTASVFR
jgi:endonuclease/exonuclease/phosphatase (EEP) superfamily protein YafD